MAKECDHASVGILVFKDDKLLLIERKLFPFGFAPPAGHIDQHGSPEQAAKDELQEETGLITDAVKLKTEGKKNNHCRRLNGDWHYWYVYTAEANGEVKGNPDETKKVGWYSVDQISLLAQRTQQYLSGKISEKDWEDSPGLEVVWLEWLKQLKII